MYDNNEKKPRLKSIYDLSHLFDVFTQRKL